MAAGRAGEEPADDTEGGLRLGCGQKERELVAADSEGTVGAAQRGPDEAADGGQQLVAGGMSLAVVEALEIVEVEDGQRERPPVAGRLGDLANELLLEGPVVAEAGERIEARVEARPLVGPARLPQVVLEPGHHADDAAGGGDGEDGRAARGDDEGEENRAARGDRDRREPDRGDQPDAAEGESQALPDLRRGVVRRAEPTPVTGERVAGCPRFHGASH